MRQAAASASSATPVECSRSHGDLRPVMRGDGRERGVDPLARDPDQRGRLALERLLPHPRLVQLGEHLVEVPHGELGEPRLVRGAGSALDDCRVPRRRRAAERKREMSRATCRRRIGSGISSPATFGNPRPSQRAKTYSSAAWMLGPRPSHPANRCATSHIVANASRALGPALAMRILDQLRADLRAAADPDVGSVEREDLRRVGGVDQVEGGPVRDVVAEELGRLVPVRRAAGGVEERDVVRVRELLRRRSGELAEADREHGGAQRVLERLPRAEVGRERQGPDHLGRADRLFVRRLQSRDRLRVLGRHIEILGSTAPLQGTLCGSPYLVLLCMAPLAMEPTCTSTRIS